MSNLFCQIEILSNIPPLHRLSTLDHSYWKTHWHIALTYSTVHCETVHLSNKLFSPVFVHICRSSMALGCGVGRFYGIEACFAIEQYDKCQRLFVTQKRNNAQMLLGPQRQVVDGGVKTLYDGRDVFYVAERRKVILRQVVEFSGDQDLA